MRRQNSQERQSHKENVLPKSVNCQSTKKSETDCFLNVKFNLLSKKIKKILSENPFRFYARNAGVVVSNWIDPKTKKISYVIYGCGLAISKRIVLTSSQNIFFRTNLQGKQQCDRVFFFPFDSDTVNSSVKKKYISSTQDFLYFKPSDIRKQPFPEDLALVVMKENMNFDLFPPIGFRMEKIIELKITFIGFSLDLQKKNGNGTNMTSQAFESIIKDVQDYRIQYVGCSTKKQHTGAAILGLNFNNEVVVLGIHTHRNPNKYINAGIYFTPSILRTLADFEKDIEFKHQIKRTILFSKEVSQYLEQKADNSFYQELREFVLNWQTLEKIDERQDNNGERLVIIKWRQ